jgi:integrase
MRRKIPTGRVFQKTYRSQSGERRTTATWYLKYYSRGKPIELSSGTDNYDEALEMLRKRMAQVADHTHHAERVTMGQLFDLLIDDYRFLGRKSTHDVELRVNAHLRPFFGKTKARSISAAMLREYVDHRRSEKRDKNTKVVENATINKELSFVRRALKLGEQQEPPLVVRIPKFAMLPVDNAREGTIDYEQYRAVRDALPGYARIALVIAYHTGARKGEICAIRLDKIDLSAGRIQLPGRTTKNRRPRYLPIYGHMAAEIDMALSACDRRCPFLIQDKGERVLNFKRAWATACKSAGIEHSLFHDLRRTAVTNMIEAGLSEKEAMEISGHKTRAVFDRYHIVSERRMRQNADKLSQFLEAKEAGLGEDKPSLGEVTGEALRSKPN